MLLLSNTLNLRLLRSSCSGLYYRALIALGHKCIIYLLAVYMFSRAFMKRACVVSQRSLRK